MAMSAKLNLLQPLTCNSDVSIWVKEDDKQQTNADLSLSFNLSFAREINSENPEVKSRETQPYIWGNCPQYFQIHTSWFEYVVQNHIYWSVFTDYRR